MKSFVTRGAIGAFFVSALLALPATAQITDRLSGISTSLAVKAPVKAVAITNITLSGEQTVNGVAVVEDDRVLVTAQTSSVDNGIYVVDTSAWERAADFDGNRDVGNGTLVTVNRDAGRNVFYQVEATDPVVIGTSAITFFEVNDPNITYDLTAYEVSAGLTLSDITDGWPELDIRRYGGVATDGSANSDQTAITNAVAVAELQGGAIYFPVGTWNGCVSIDAEDVSVVGDGARSSFIECDNGDGITLAYTTGIGSTTIRDVGIVCTQGTDNYGIKAAAHSTDSSVELYGLTVERTWISGCEVAFHSRTLRNFALLNNWWQSVDKALELIGKNLVGRIAYNTFVFADVDGANEDTGVAINGYTYATGGFVAPEGIVFADNQVYGFDQAVDVDFCNVCKFVNNDFQATVYGFEFTTVQQQLTIADNNFDLVGAGVTAGIIGHGLASEIDTLVNIRGNSLLASTTTAASGIVINDAGNTNQYWVNISENFLDGFDTHDILLNNAGFTTVRDNRCASSDPTNSINVTNVQSGKGPVIIDGNRCDKAILFSYSEVELGEVVVGVNQHSAATLLTGYEPLHTQDTRTGAGAISLTTRITLVVTTAADALTLADGFEGQEKIITMITDGGDGTLTPTNLFNGTTITFNDVDDTVVLKFVDGEWHVLSNDGATRA